MYDQLLIAAVLISSLGLFWVVRQWRSSPNLRNTKRTPAGPQSGPE
jgi:hypothetical protein